MSGPRFTEKARAAAAISRRLRAEQRALAKNDPEVFALRTADPRKFTWQVRKFGGVIVMSADESYSSAGIARQAGIAALQKLGSNPSIARQ